MMICVESSSLSLRDTRNNAADQLPRLVASKVTHLSSSNDKIERDLILHLATSSFKSGKVVVEKAKGDSNFISSAGLPNE
jgi:hypothetical protein